MKRILDPEEFVSLYYFMVFNEFIGCETVTSIDQDITIREVFSDKLCDFNMNAVELLMI